MASPPGVPSEGARRRVRDGAIALSLANLVYWPVWRALLELPSPYLAQAPPPPVYFVSAAVGVGLFAGAFFLVRWLLQRAGGRVRSASDWLVPAAWMAPLGLLWLNAEAAFAGTLGVGVIRLAGGGVVAALGFAAVRYRVGFLAAAELMALVFLPFAGVTAARSLWAGASGVEAQGPASLAPIQSSEEQSSDEPTQASRPRVVWIVMDEFDYRLAFDARPPSVELPAFDRLRGESLFASQASSPAWRTLLSMPALINGKLVADAKIASADELLVTFEGGPSKASWSEEPNLFSRLRDRGGNVGVVGFYHPYCRLFPTLLSDCSVAPFLTGWGDPSFREALVAQWGILARELPPFEALGLGSGLQRHRDELYMRGLRSGMLSLNEQLLQATRDMLSRRDLQLMLIHLAVPHPPGVFDRKTDRASNSPGATYLDNLVLADRTLAELRALAERDGSWPDTTWIVSSDHWWKSNFWATEPGWSQEEARLQSAETDRRVPFVVKLAGARDAVEYRKPLNTVVSASLIEALWDEGFTSHRSLAKWLAAGGRLSANEPRPKHPSP